MLYYYDDVSMYVNSYPSYKELIPTPCFNCNVIELGQNAITDSSLIWLA